MTATAAPVTSAPAGPPAPQAAPRRPAWVRWSVIAAAVVGLAVIGLLFLGRPDFGRPPPFSPDSEWPDGTKALVMLLEAEGAEVDVTSDVPDDVDDLDDVDVVLLPFDYIVDLSSAYALDEWVEDGGRLVVTDHLSQFTAYVSGDVTPGGPLAAGSCTIDALEGIDEIAPGGGQPLYDTYFGEGRCFTAGGEAFVVATDVGRGTIVSVGSPDVFTNRLLAESGNAGLAVALMAPEPGTRVRYLDLDLSMPPPERPDEEVPNPLAGFFDMVPPGVRAGLVQLVLAFVVYAWWRGRRLGRPVPESRPVEVEGSELVQAVGRLMARSRDPARAAALLRADLRRSLTDRLGLPRDADDDVVARLAAERSGVDEASVRAALDPLSLNIEASVLDLAVLVESVRHEVLHGSAP